jgi:hypothetical protein
MMRFAAVLGLSSLSSLALVAADTCDQYADTNLPCLEVPRCNATASLNINTLSSGAGPSVSNSVVSLCFDDVNLYVTHEAQKQTLFTDPGYTECDDSIFNSNVAEMFIAPNMEQIPHCYNELDISPFNVMFDAGIYSPNLNQTGIVGSTFPCEGTGICYEAAMHPEEEYWTAKMSFSFALLNCPYNCPLTHRYCGHTFANAVYRANFFRINELTPTDHCSSESCEYMAWSPTLATPAAFHVPSQFGYLLLQL